MDNPVSAYKIRNSPSIQKWNPCCHVYQIMTGSPSIGDKVRKRMFGQSFGGFDGVIGASVSVWWSQEIIR